MGGITWPAATAIVAIACSSKAFSRAERTAASQLAKAPAHTACICPGFTDTELLREHVPETVGLAGESAHRR